MTKPLTVPVTGREWPERGGTGLSTGLPPSPTSLHQTFISLFVYTFRESRSKVRGCYSEAKQGLAGGCPKACVYPTAITNKQLTSMRKLELKSFPNSQHKPLGDASPEWPIEAGCKLGAVAHD